jgi:two-component system clock-associated histidine kinase SasA
VLQHHQKGEDVGADTVSQVSLQLLLFIDRRPSSQENIDQIIAYLKSIKGKYKFDLQVYEITEHPQLVEHFKLVATPALVKIHPMPRHILAGSDLVAQIEKWLPRWLIPVEPKGESLGKSRETEETIDFNMSPETCSSELMHLADEIFALKKERQQLLEQLSFKDRLLAMLAHDLRSPLTAALIALETLELGDNKGEYKIPPTLRSNLYKQARKQFQIMNRMITDLLQASKNINAHLEIKPTKFYLQSLCEDVLRDFAPAFEAKSQKLNQDIPQDLPPVYADEELIRQVIVNLLDNANKYTPEEGTIGFSILHRTTQKIQISVSDTGPGIPKETQEMIFEEHFRLKRDQTQEGYGLGLAFCRNIIRVHYGQIWVERNPSQGSCFNFTLPVYL